MFWTTPLPPLERDVIYGWSLGKRTSQMNDESMNHDIGYEFQENWAIPLKIMLSIVQRDNVLMAT